MVAQLNLPQDRRYRPLGRTGAKVSALGLGTMNFGAPTSEAESIRILHAALDAGINLVDTADVYNSGESERIVGKGLADHRDDVFLATKVYYPTGSRPNDGGLSRQHILRACEESLRRLDTDHIDLYQLHRPLFDLPQDETLRALDDLIHQGKVRYIGVSTFPAWLTVEAIHISERLGLNRFVSEQPPYNLLDRRIENELVPMCQRYGLAILPWSPLGGGILAGRYPPGARPPKGSRFTRLGYFKERVSRRARELAVKIEQIAVEIGLSLPQLALLWVKEQPGVTSPIIGPRTLEHLQTALEIFGQELDPEIAVRLDELNPPGSAVADFFNTAAWMKMRVPIE